MECLYVHCAKDCRVWITLDLAFIYAFSVALCGASLIKTPNNKVVFVGQRMEMECWTVNGSIFRKWDLLQVGSESPRTIAINDNTNIAVVPNISGFGVDVDHNGSVLLYSKSTKTMDAGVYICQGEKGSTEFKYSAQLIVLDSEPICETNLIANATGSDGDYVWLLCRVNFRGNWAPTMEWRQHPVDADNDEGRLLSNETVTVVNETSNITSTLIVLIDSTNYDSYFSCRTYFTWHNGRLRTNATNIPDFSHTWISNSTANLIARPTTSAGGNSDSTTAQYNTDLVWILFGVLSVTLLLMMMATVAICCVIIRRKTAAWMAQVVSTYENRERPRSVRDSRGFSLNTLRRQMKANSQDKVGRPEREPSDGYASVDDLTEECNQAMGGRPSTSELPKYTAVFKKRTPPAACAAAASAHYSMAKDDVVLDYATLRKNIEPPKWDTNHDSTDSDSESEDLK